MNVLDLFSGIGGFSVGLEKAGFNTVAFCEIEPYCQGVLRKHWPDTPIYNDVRSLTAEQLRADGLVWPDVIVGGYPCQPFSVAGKQRGAEDDRHLWPEVYRLIKEIRPSWGIFENVAGHITMGLDEVLSDLEAEGYAARPFVIPACGVDAPHRRDRVWIVAHSNRSADRRASRKNEGTDGEISQRDIGGVADQSGEVCAANVGDTKRSRQSGNDGWRSGQEPADGCADVADADDAGGGTPRRGDDGERKASKQGRQNQPLSQSGGQREAVADTKGIERDEQQRGGQPEKNGQGRLRGEVGASSFDTRRPTYWPTEPNVGRVVNGVPNRSHRVKALGNAVVPQIPEVIGRIIMEVEASNERI